MKLCLVSQQIDDVRTGLGTYANALVPAVAAAGHDVTLIGRGGTPAWPGVVHHVVPRAAGDPTPEGWLSFAWAAARRLAGLGRFDCVHFKRSIVQLLGETVLGRCVELAAPFGAKD